MDAIKLANDLRTINVWWCDPALEANPELTHTNRLAAEELIRLYDENQALKKRLAELTFSPEESRNVLDAVRIAALQGLV